MTTTTPWSDTPPSPDKPGWYHTKEIADGEERPMWMSSNGNWDDAAYSYHTGERLVQFGPAVLSAEETVKLTAEVKRLRAENAALRESRTEADERAAFDEWHQSLYGWKWDSVETPDGEDARARARWMAWRARAGLKGGAS